jgi:hypothetical protein
MRSGSKAVHEHDRLAFPLVQKCNFDPVVQKTLHVCNLQSRLRGCDPL